MIKLIKELKIDGCNKEYTIDEYGNIFDVKLQRYRKPIVHKKGYLKMSFYVNGKDKKFFIHRLVLQTFKPVEDMDKLQVNHIDGDKQNNHVDNLEWCTQSENQKHAYKHGLNSNKGEHNPSCRLTEEQVIEIADLLIKSVPMSEIARRYGISKSAVAFIREKRHWKYLLEDYNFPKYCSLK